MFEHRKSRPRLLCVGLCGGLLASTSSRAMSPGRAVEPAPAIYASGPTITGRTWEMILPNLDQVDYICRLANGGLPEGARRGAYYWGCYHEKLDAVVLVDPKAWPSRREWREVRQHEWGHARGWRHYRNGHGTDWARSLPPPGSASVRLAAATPAP